MFSHLTLVVCRLMRFHMFGFLRYASVISACTAMQWIRIVCAAQSTEANVLEIHHQCVSPETASPLLRIFNTPQTVFTGTICLVGNSSTENCCDEVCELSRETWDTVSGNVKVCAVAQGLQMYTLHTLKIKYE